MARYFFNTVDGHYERDEEGTELPDLASARIQATKYAGEVLVHRPQIIWEGEEFRVEVTDSKGLLLFTLIMFGVDAPALRTAGPASPR